jgi:hypothetical protein
MERALEEERQRQQRQEQLARDVAQHVRELARREEIERYAALCEEYSRRRIRSGLGE